MTAKKGSEKKASSRENLSKYFYDLSRTTFSATVVGDVVTMFLKEEITTSSIILFIAGIISTSILARVAYKLSMK